MYKIDWDILKNNSMADEFNEELKLLARGVVFKDVKYDSDGDVEYLIMQNGAILANNGNHPKMMELSDYFSDGDVLLFADEVKALVNSYIYTHQQKLEVLFIGEMCYFVKDEMGNEFALERDSSEIVEEDDLSNKFEIDMGEFRKEDFLKALEIIKKGVVSLK